MTVTILLASRQHQEGSVLEQTLQTLGAKIVPATDVDTARLASQEHDFGLLILDEALPELAEQIRHFTISPAATILVLAAPGQHTATCDTSGVGEYTDIITPPFDPPQLLNKLLTLLHIHHLKKELIACASLLQEQKTKDRQWQVSLEQQNHYLNMLSVRDGLTGLFNRRHLGQVLEQEIAKAREQGSDLALLLLDIDYFNETNRISGQIFGDSILNELSARLTQNAREHDICFRFGGSDFIILLPGTGLDMARTHAERLRRACADKPFTSGQHSRSITVSISVVTLLAHSPRNQDDFISMADKAMYQAKSGGRNRVVLFEQQNPAASDGKVDTINLLQEMLQRILEKTKTNSIASIQILTQNITGGDQNEHVEMATQYIQLFCKRLGLPTNILETFANALTLYSCFRLLLYRELLAKKEKFSLDDRKQVNDLPYKLAELTRHFDYFANERNMLLCQGEHYDGSGTPEGLAGEEIPLAARIFSLADALAAMNSDRPHRKRLTAAEILHELSQGAGTQWDPTLVLLALDLLQEQHFFVGEQELFAATRVLVAAKTPQDLDRGLQ